MDGSVRFKASFLAHQTISFMSRVTHFGTLTTSRLEGSHAVLKAGLGTSRNDLLGFFQKADLYLLDQWNGIKANNKRTTPYSLCTEFWQSVTMIIHHYALHMAREQYMLAKEELAKQKEQIAKDQEENRNLRAKLT